MKKITAADLLYLNFDKVDVPTEESGDENEFTYYTFDIGNDNCLLISNTSDECDNNYTIEFFNHEGEIMIQDLNHLTQLIKIIKLNMKINE